MACLLAALFCAPGRAGAAAADSLAVADSIAADSAAVTRPVAPTADSTSNSVMRGGSSSTRDVRVPRPRPTRADSVAKVHVRWYDQPRWVMARSAVIPGWGQLHNGAWLKAGAVAATEAYLTTRIVDDDKRLKDLTRDVDAAVLSGDADSERLAVDRYNAVLDRYVRRQWLLAGALVYALADAYVDAHFVKFKLEFEHDPALPGGVSGARISMERKF